MMRVSAYYDIYARRGSMLMLRVDAHCCRYGYTRYLLI